MALKDEDFDEEARKIFRSLNIPQPSRKVSHYNPLDPIWKDDKTGGVVYVGNHIAASDEAVLKAAGVTHVVNCTDNMEMFMEGRPGFSTMRFDVATGGVCRACSEEGRRCRIFFKPMYDFVEEALEQGRAC